MFCLSSQKGSTPTEKKIAAAGLNLERLCQMQRSKQEATKIVPSIQTGGKNLIPNLLHSGAYLFSSIEATSIQNFASRRTKTGSNKCCFPS